MAGAGIKKGMSYGATDDYCYNITENPVHVHDLNATIMHLMGVNHKKLTYRISGQRFSFNRYSRTSYQGYPFLIFL